MNLTYAKAPQRRADDPFEVVERKGHGHPDTLADALGEHLSRAYARHTLKEFGLVLHHQFDKVGIMGGRVHVAFGEGSLLEPVRVLLNGRASVSFAGTPIPVRDLLTSACLDFFAGRFPMLDVGTDMRILYEVSAGDSPGGVGAKNEANRRSRWFTPAGPGDLPELAHLVCNDTSSGAAYSPPTPTEQFVLDVEGVLEAGTRPAWLGSDIKVMACRDGGRIDVTACIPQLSAHVPDLDTYLANRDWAQARLASHAARALPGHQVTIHLNTRDDPARPELYLTFTGSSIETGDEGFVGRGNRYGGLISASRPFTMEGISGKNPVYHTGKVYCVGAALIATAIWERFGHGAEVIQPVVTPHATVVRVEPGATGTPAPDAAAVRPCIADGLAAIPGSVEAILSGAHRLH